LVKLRMSDASDEDWARYAERRRGPFWMMSFCFYGSQKIRLFVRQGVATMPFSRKTEVSDADLDALVAYLTQPKP
jgi:hypothetical protein